MEKYRRKHYKTYKSLNSNEIQAPTKRLLDNFMKKDYGDERDIEEEYFYGRDIEVDGDYILDYSNCRSARDFEIVTKNFYREKRRVHILKSDVEDKKTRIIRKFKWLERNKGLKFPRISDMAIWLGSEAYQDKVKIYQELIDVLQDEINEYNNSSPKDDFIIPW